MSRAQVIRGVTVGGVVGSVINVFLAYGAVPRQPVGATSAAVETCTKILPTAREYGAEEVVMAEQSTAAEVADWQENRHAPEVTWRDTPFRSAPPDQVVTVCLFSGSFVTPTGGPGLDGRTPPQHDVLTLLVADDGEIAVYMDGSKYPLMTAADDTFDSGRGGFGFERPAPGLGEHNDEVYRDLLGYPPDRVEQLRREGVI
jgi:hypothetical protein